MTVRRNRSQVATHSAIVIEMLGEAGSAGVLSGALPLTPAERMSVSQYLRECGVPVVIERAGQFSRWYLDVDSLDREVWDSSIARYKADAYSALVRLAKAATGIPAIHDTAATAAISVGALVGKHYRDVVADVESVSTPPRDVVLALRKYAPAAFPGALPEDDPLALLDFEPSI